MKLLLDTHFLVWMIHAPARVHPREYALFDQAEVETCVSALSLWEIRIKWQQRHPSGERKGELGTTETLAFLQRRGWRLVDLSVADAATSLDHPLGHRDPFDEQLLIQAQRLGARLLTRDRHLLDHPLAWRFT